jgi:hypothetical protein
MDAQLLKSEPTPSHGKRFPRWAVAALSSVATIAAYQALSSPLPQRSQELFTLFTPSWTLPNGESSLKDALTNIEYQANNNSAAIERLDTSKSSVCHPLDGQQKKLLIRGFNNGYGSSGFLQKWLSFNTAGHWMNAGYNDASSASPLLFRAFPDKCNTYYLQNKYNNDDKWLSFTSGGKWIRAIYEFGSAMPVEFLDSGDGTGAYKMKNEYPGEGFYYISYANAAQTSNGYHLPAKTLKAVYTNQDAMIATLHEV